jgi:hypothetical protein
LTRTFVSLSLSHEPKARVATQTLVCILCKKIHNSKKDWDSKLTIALWAYSTTYKVTTHATPFSLVYSIEAILPIEFEIPSLRIAINDRLDES